MKDNTKFLGVIIDKYLDFNEHIQYIKGKISRGLGILYKCRRLFISKTLITLYNSFLYPYMNYCVSIWGNTYDSYLDPLIKLQKRAVRVLVGAERNSHTDPIFRKLRLLKLCQIYLYSVQLFMFKYHHQTLPDIFNDFFIRNSSFHDYNTRSQNLLRLHKPQSAKSERIIRVMGARSYNYFDCRINIDCSYLSYKVALRICLINNDIKALGLF